MKFELMDAQKTLFPVKFMCEQLGVSRSDYYAWQRRPESALQASDRVTGRGRHSGAPGESPDVWQSASARGAACPRPAGEPQARGVTHSCARAGGAQAARRYVTTTDSRHRQPVAPNVLARDFSPAQPNTTWATDITSVDTREGWLYLAVVLDLFSRKGVGWSVSDTIDRHLVLGALDMALKSRQPPRWLVHHSDRGSQYASEECQQALAARGMECSMSRKGNCWDNAVVESFFSTLKQELVYTTDFTTREQARLALFEYIEVFYNRQRRHSTLGYVSPVNFELAALPQKLAA